MRQKLIYPKFIGRLGNNLFQIAACIGYAKKHNVGWGIKKGYVERGFGVHQLDKFFPHLPLCEESFRRYAEPNFFHTEIPFQPQGVEIVGFWQSLKYFENAQEEVSKAFDLIIYDEMMEGHISIHIRRGDYASNPDHFPPVTTEYLNMALEILQRKGVDTHFIDVFSDDIQWCKENLARELNGPSHHFYFHTGNEYQDLCMMASCSHNIIANSSFSWWGAFLNPNPDKIVISPSHDNWFGPKNGVRDQTQDLIPNDWIQIKFR